MAKLALSTHNLIRHWLVTVGVLTAVAGLMLCSVPKASAQNGYLVDTFNTSAVINGPQKPTIVTLSQQAAITTFATYHWNNGQGAIPGTIKFVAVSANQTPTGQSWGPYGTGTQSGQTGVADTAWVGTMGGQGLLLPAGSYKIEDSDPGTWSTNAQAGYQGFVRLTGAFTSSTPVPAPAPASAPAPVPAPAPLPPAAPLSVTLAPITASYVFVNGQSQYSVTFSWTASGGTSPLTVSIQDMNTGYKDHTMPGFVDLPYPARTSGTYYFTLTVPSPTIEFRAMVKDSTGAVAYSAWQPIP